MPDICIVSQVLGGMLEEIWAFTTRKKAVTWLEERTKNTDFHKTDRDHWRSDNNDETLAIWIVDLK